MTTAVLPARPTLSTRLRPRGTFWLVWRQNRFALLAVTVVFAGLIAYLLHEHVRLDAAAARFHALRCAPLPGQACDDAETALYESTSDWGELVLILLALPGLLGAVLAAQPLAVDFERGRHLLLWSQSVSPRRWFTYRLALPAAVLLVLSTAMSVTVRWVAFWSHPDPMADAWSRTLGLHDLVPVYPVLTLAAFALGALVGLLIHRAVAALGVTLALYAVLVYAVDRVYPILLPLHRRTLTGYIGMRNDWVYRTGFVVGGKDITVDQCSARSCLTAPRWQTYHTAAEFGPMLWIEAGLLAVVTALLVVAAYRRLRALTR